MATNMKEVTNMLNVDKQLNKQVMKDLIATIDDEDPDITDFEDLLSNTNNAFFWDDSTVDMYFSSLSGLDLFNKLSDLANFYHGDTLLYKLLADRDDPSYLMEYLAYQALYKLLAVKQGFNDTIVDFIGSDVGNNTLINNYAKVDKLSELVENLIGKEWD